MSNAYSGANLKKSSLYFLIGKICSGILTFVILILLARLLDSPDYGAYVTLIAILELGFAVGNLGIGWVSNRYIPEYRLHASSRDLSILITSIISLRTIALVVVAVCVILFDDLLVDYLHLGKYSSAIHIYSYVLVVEGLGRAIRDEIFSALLQQKSSQIILILRNLALLLFVFIGAQETALDLTRFAWMELYASLVGTSFSLLGILVYMLKLKQVRVPEWQIPKLKQFVRTARAMYASFLLTMAGGQQVFMFLVNALLGLEAAAIFGFASNLNDMLKRYLPAELLMGLIQPKLVADYSLHNDMHRLSRHALFAWKFSLIVLIPAVSFFIVCGESFSALISTGKFTGAGPILAGLAISLIPFSQHRILETIANILGHPEACITASFLSLMSLPLALVLIEQDLGLWAVVIALIVAELVFNLSLALRMKREGCPYGLDLSMLSKLVMLISAVTFIVQILMNLPSQDWFQLLLSSQEWLEQSLGKAGKSLLSQLSAIFLAVFVTAILAWDIGFFSREELKGMQVFLRPRGKQGGL